MEHDHEWLDKNEPATEVYEDGSDMTVIDFAMKYAEHIHREPSAVSVSIYGMNDNHTFVALEATSVQGIIDRWVDRGSTYYGVPALCPAIVLDSNGKELRRVGPMVHRAGDAEGIVKYRAALESDPDVVRLLQSTNTNE